MRHESESWSAFAYPTDTELQNVQSAPLHTSQAINRSHFLTRAGLSHQSYVPLSPFTVGVIPTEHMDTQGHEETTSKSLLLKLAFCRRISRPHDIKQSTPRGTI